MKSIFKRIIDKEIPAYILAEDEDHIAFLDAFPLVKGHALVLPKKEIDYLFDMPDAELASVNLFAKKIAKAMKMAIPCKKIGVAVIGLEVPHAHIHLIPINQVGDINFANPKLTLKPEEMVEVQDAILHYL